MSTDAGTTRRGRNAARAELVARACIAQYEALPAKGAKPARRSDGRHEWTVLAGIVLCLGAECVPVSVATGLKVLPQQVCTANGDQLRDSHAEVLARRGARSWLLARLVAEHAAGEYAAGELANSIDGCIFEQTGEARWKLKDEVELVWYISTLPCGDASSDLLLAQRAAADRHGDAAGHTTAPEHAELLGHTVAGRMSLHSGPSLRTKPGRPDALPSISHSCTDKLALWSSVGLQGSLLSRYLQPVRFGALVVGERAAREAFVGGGGLDWAERRDEWQRSVERALGSRLDGDGPSVHFVAPDFSGSRETVRSHLAGVAEEHMVAAAGSVSWIRGRGKSENIVDGIRQGASAKRAGPLEPLRAPSRSRLCKLAHFREAQAAAAALDPAHTPAPSYLVAKQESAAYRRAKANARGVGDADASGASRAVEHFLARAVGAERPAPPPLLSDAPFAGWLVTPRELERFDAEGRILHA